MGAPAAVAVLTIAGAPAHSRAMLVAGWTAADLVSLISRPNMGTALESMTTAGLNHDDLGAITAVARVAGVTETRLQLMMEDANFQAGTVLMTAAGWTTDDLGNFIAGIDRTNLPVADIGTLSNTANFGTNSHPWIAAGFTADEVGQICGHARLANGGAFLPAPLTTFLGTANAEMHAAALNGVWTVPDIGTTIGYCRTQAGPPTDAQMVDLVERAAVPAGVAGAQIRAVGVQHAALAATCGAPAW